MPAVSILLVAVLIRVLSGHAAAPPPRWAPGDPTENVTAMAAVIHNEIGDKVRQLHRNRNIHRNTTI